MANKTISLNEMAMVSHPKDTLAEKLQEVGMSIKEFAIRTSKPEKTIHAVLSGNSSITTDMAIAFEKVLHIPARFWIAKQKHYDEYVARLKHENKAKESEDWVKSFPYVMMCKFGWLPSASSIKEKYNNLLRFFSVSSTDAWEDIYLNQELRIAFRMSLANEKNPHAVSAWLRQGEIMANSIQLNSEYSQVAMRNILPSLLEVLYLFPKDYKLQLQSLFASVGVKLIFIHFLPKAPISGCARWINDKPCIFITDRYKRYDIFSFTLLHEFCHILKHGKKDIFIEGCVDTGEMLSKENEANTFASNLLFDKDSEEEFVKCGDFSEPAIYRASNRYKVHSSVIVGRLKHRKIIPHSTLPNLMTKIDLYND